MNSYELEQALACKQMEVEDLRQQVTLLRDCLKKIEARFDYGPSYGSVEWMTLNDVVVALAATKEQ